MKILVRGILNFREFIFPQDMFHPRVSHKFASIGIGSSYLANDLTPHARQLAADILALGRFEEVVFLTGKLRIWSNSEDEFTLEVIDQIEDLILKHYGPPAERVVYLPFGYKLILPPK